MILVACSLLLSSISVSTDVEETQTIDDYASQKCVLRYFPQDDYFWIRGKVAYYDENKATRGVLGWINAIRLFGQTNKISRMRFHSLQRLTDDEPTLVERKARMYNRILSGKEHCYMGYEAISVADIFDCPTRVNVGDIVPLDIVHEFMADDLHGEEDVKTNPDTYYDNKQDSTLTPKLSSHFGKVVRIKGRLIRRYYTYPDLYEMEVADGRGSIECFNASAYGVSGCLVGDKARDELPLDTNMSFVGYEVPLAIVAYGWDGAPYDKHRYVRRARGQSVFVVCRIENHNQKDEDTGAENSDSPRGFKRKFLESPFDPFWVEGRVVSTNAQEGKLIVGRRLGSPTDSEFCMVFDPIDVQCMGDKLLTRAEADFRTKVASGEKNLYCGYEAISVADIEKCPVDVSLGDSVELDVVRKFRAHVLMGDKEFQDGLLDKKQNDIEEWLTPKLGRCFGKVIRVRGCLEERIRTLPISSYEMNADFPQRARIECIFAPACLGIKEYKDMELPLNKELEFVGYEIPYAGWHHLDGYAYYDLVDHRLRGQSIFWICKVCEVKQ